MCCSEYTPSQYLETKESLLAKVQALDVLIEKTMALTLDTGNGLGGNISTYELDDGQVRIKTGYRSMKEVSDGIFALEKLQQMYLNRLNGRKTVLVDRKVLQRGGYGRGCC